MADMAMDPKTIPPAIFQNRREVKTTVIVLAYPVRGAGIDQELLGLAFHHQGPAFLQ